MNRLGVGAVPVILARLEEDAVAGSYQLDRTAALLREADAFENVDRLAVRVRMPRRACAGGEMDAARSVVKRLTASRRCRRRPR